MERELPPEFASLTLPDTIMRGTDVIAAVSANDWDTLRTLSLEDGGFGDARTRAWPHLLHVDTGHLDTPLPPVSQDPHPDERQIGLDTDRSFVLYPVGKRARCGPVCHG